MVQVDNKAQPESKFAVLFGTVLLYQSREHCIVEVQFNFAASSVILEDNKNV